MWGIASAAGDLHAFDQHRTAQLGAARQGIVTHRDDVAEHVAQVAGDGDLLDGVLDLALLDPEACRTARVIARDVFKPGTEEADSRETSDDAPFSALAKPLKPYFS